MLIYIYHPTNPFCTPMYAWLVCSNHHCPDLIYRSENYVFHNLRCTLTYRPLTYPLRYLHRPNCQLLLFLANNLTWDNNVRTRRRPGTDLAAGGQYPETEEIRGWSHCQDCCWSGCFCRWTCARRPATPSLLARGSPEIIFMLT